MKATEKILSPFDLTAKQKELFNKLKKAYKDCEKSGIYMVNNYGFLEAYNSKWVKLYSDRSSLDKSHECVVSTHDYSASNYFTIENEWTDDEHLIELTNEGLEKLKEYES